VKAAKGRKHLLDATVGRKIRSVILFNEGTVMLSSLRFETLLMRLNGDMRGNLYDRDSEYAETDPENTDGVEADSLINNEEGKEESTFDEGN